MLKEYDFNKLTPESIAANTDRLIAEQQILYDAIGSIALNEVSYSNVIQAINDAMRERSNKSAALSFPQHAAVDKAVRDASCKADTLLEKFDVEVSVRKDIFDRIIAFKENIGLDNCNAEQKRFVEKLIRTGKRNGLHLSEEIRNQIKDIKTRISELSIQYGNNLNEENTKLYFTREELVGMPDDFINNLKEIDNKLEVSLKYPHLLPITKKCRNADTRRQMITANHSKCIKENTPILEELIQLRHKQAKLLGYPNHAAYIHEERMAKTPENVASFLNDLTSKLQKLWKSELEVLIKLKKEECDKYGFENSGKIEFWDTSYYMNLVEETVYAVDEEEVRQYFPIEKVTEGLLQIYQQLLGLKFHVEDQVVAWHEDVVTYRVNDAESSELLGYFFFDPFPREGKFGHYAAFSLRSSCLDDEGKMQPAIRAMMCNFTKPTKDKPALLTHSEVETFFHEFGHVMHGICSRATIQLLSGTSVERDFVEAPSQMLENWVWEKEPLRLMSAHHKTGEPLTDNLIEKLAQSRKANAGGFNLRQIALATFDQRIYTRDQANTAELFFQTYQEILGLSPIKDTNMPASFQHVVDHYDAQYYGYLWSEVFAMDMFESRFKNELLSPEIGMDYRIKILQPGGSKDAADMLKEFLGREPTNDAFLRSKGLID